MIITSTFLGLLYLQVQEDLFGCLVSFLYQFYSSFYLSRRRLVINWPRGYKTFFMLNSIEHEIFPAHRC